MNEGNRPGIRYLDGIRLNRGLCAGFDRLIADHEVLNQINVFPVPDGDTGTNLAFTVATISDALRDLDVRHAGELLTTVADAALDGARGNSGAIFAQIFQGFADALGDRAQISPADFTAAVRTADEYARSALTKPREGTIVTVVNQFSRAIDACVEGDPTGDFVKLLAVGLEAADRALSATTEQLEELKRANVVDAGAMGFVLVLRGIQKFISRGALTSVPVPMLAGDTATMPAPATRWSGAVDHRYCTECLVTGSNGDLRKLREQLSEIGSSLVVAGSQRKIKVHIHVDDPAQVFEIAGRFGEVSAEKADDIQQQADTMQLDARGIAIVTDSAADMPDALLHDLDIHVVPLRIQFGESSYLDKIGLTQEQFFEELASNPAYPRTSQPAPGDFRRMYDYLGSHFEHVVSISLTKTVSGTWQAATTASERTQRPEKITVVDSENVSLGQGLVVMHAAECVRDGLGLDEVLESVDVSIGQIKTFGMFTDLSYAVRGGRLKPSIRWAAERLRMTPILSTTGRGKVGVRNFLLGRRNLLNRFARFVSRQTRNGRSYRVAVGHSNCEADAERLQSALLDRLSSVESSFITELGSALGVHTGPGALVVALQECAPAAPR